MTPVWTGVIHYRGWKNPRSGRRKRHPLYAGSHSEEAKVLNSAPMFDNLKRRDNTIWAPLALSNGRLIIRNLEVMKCLDLRSGK